MYIYMCVYLCIYCEILVGLDNTKDTTVQHTVHVHSYTIWLDRCHGNTVCGIKDELPTIRWQSFLMELHSSMMARFTQLPAGGHFLASAGHEWPWPVSWSELFLLYVMALLFACHASLEASDVSSGPQAHITHLPCNMWCIPCSQGWPIPFASLYGLQACWRSTACPRELHSLHGYAQKTPVPPA